MSRTFRRKNATEEKNWVLTDWVYVSGFSQKVRIPEKSREGQKAVAKFHSDAHPSFKEPGPKWFRNLFAERPQRREAKRQLKNFLKDPDREVILRAKDPLPYWT